MSQLEKKLRQTETLKRLRSLQKREKMVVEAEMRKSLEEAKAKELRAEALYQWTMKRTGHKRHAGLAIDPLFYTSGLESMEQTFARYREQGEQTAHISTQRDKAVEELMTSHAHYKLAEDMYKELTLEKEKETQRHEFLDQCIVERRSK